MNSAKLDSVTAIFNSGTLLSSLRFTQKHSYSTLTLTQTNSILLKLIHSHLTWWWPPSWSLPSWILPSWIQPSKYFLSNSLTLAKIGSHNLHKKNFTHSFWLNLMMAAILNSAMLNLAHLGFRHLVIFSHIHSKTLSLHSDSDWN